jgi:alpha-beta hydrolase superfamily lysophospholipase
MSSSIIILSAALFFSGYVSAQKAYFQPRVVTFPTEDGGAVTGHLYGRGKRGVVLVHGGRYRKESWRQQANLLTDAGFRVLSIDLRGFGNSKGPGHEDVYSAPLHLDVLAAVRYLREQGARSVAVIGGSLGGGAGADAVTEARPGEIDRLITLGGLMWNKSPEKVNVPLLVIITKDDASGSGPRLPGIQASFDKIPPGQKRIEILEGSAHAQAMFETNDSDLIMEMIIKFLRES